MNQSTLGKIGGWIQFALTAVQAIVNNGNTHGWAGWLTLAASLAAAIGIHASSNTGGPTQGS